MLDSGHVYGDGLGLPLRFAIAEQITEMSMKVFPIACPTPCMTQGKWYCPDRTQRYPSARACVRKVPLHPSLILTVKGHYSRFAGVCLVLSPGIDNNKQPPQAGLQGPIEATTVMDTLHASNKVILMMKLPVLAEGRMSYRMGLRAISCDLTSLIANPYCVLASEGLVLSELVD